MDSAILNKPPLCLTSFHLLMNGDSRRNEQLRNESLIFESEKLATKEIELRRSRWLNPITLGLIAATLGLAGNAFVAFLANRNSQDVERIRAQSNLVVDAIRTGTGNTDAACKNLVFLVQLGLLDDSGSTIRNQCVKAPAGPPSLPAQTFNSAGNSLSWFNIVGTVVDESGNPLVGATVDLTLRTSIGPNVSKMTILSTEKTNDRGLFEFHGLAADVYQVMVTKEGYEPTYETAAGGGLFSLKIVLKRLKG